MCYQKKRKKNVVATAKAYCVFLYNYKYPLETLIFKERGFYVYVYNLVDYFLFLSFFLLFFRFITGLRTE